MEGSDFSRPTFSFFSEVEVSGAEVLLERAVGRAGREVGSCSNPGAKVGSSLGIAGGSIAPGFMGTRLELSGLPHLPTMPSHTTNPPWSGGAGFLFFKPLSGLLTIDPKEPIILPAGVK